MKFLKVILTTALLLVTPLLYQTAAADSAEFSPQKFIEIASIRCISEIEMAKVALRKSSSPEVKAFAETMIADYTEVLNGLRMAAQAANEPMLDDTQLQSKARIYVFERKGSTFDTAYAGIRAAERRKTVNLFREAVGSNHAVLKPYADATLPALMRHLYLAQRLVEGLDKDKPRLLSGI